MPKQKIKIDILSDVVCPWCIIGYKRLEKALATFDDSLVTEIHWHPYEMHPDMPIGGVDLHEHFATKYGAPIEVRMALRAKHTATGIEEGFTFNYRNDMRIYNTRNAHKIINWSKAFNRQTAMHLKLFEAYFTRLQAIDDHEVLIAAVDEIGLDGRQAKTILLDNNLDREIEQTENHWKKDGIQSIPTFIFNDQKLISGGQDSQIFVQTINNLS